MYELILMEQVATLRQMRADDLVAGPDQLATNPVRYRVVEGAIVAHGRVYLDVVLLACEVVIRTMAWGRVNQAGAGGIALLVFQSHIVSRQDWTCSINEHVVV